MKRKLLMSLAASSVAILGSSTTSFSQLMEYDAVFAATVNGVDVGATMALDWYESELVVTVTNTTADDVGSFIDQFYLMRPAGPFDPSLTDTIPDPEWDLATSLDNQLKYFFPGGVDTDNYFGAEWNGGNSDPLGRIYAPDPDGTNPRTFHFGYGDSVVFADLDLDSWMDSDFPQLFMRWQGIGQGDWSAKGISGPGFEPGTDPAVPEPSHIAAMAMLGLTGFLFLRRRFRRK